MVENTLQDNTTFWSPYYTVIENALAGFGIVSGCAISKGTGDWDIDVTAGTVFVTGTGEVSVSSGTVTLTAPASDADMDAGESRIDLVTSNASGTLAGVEGAAATDPDAPDVPSDEVVLGFVVVAESDSTAADSDIVDVPALLGDDSARYDAGGSHAVEILDTGTYTGDGTATQSITGVGFTPTLVWIFDNSNDRSYAKFTGTDTIEWTSTGNPNFVTDIESLDSDGFTVSGQANTSASTFHYLAVG